MGLFFIIAIGVLVILLIVIKGRENTGAGSIKQNLKYEIQSVALPKGKGGENFVHYLLTQLGPEYVVMDDVMINTTHATTQIDHVVISRFGIFAIETKDYHGKIYGSEDAQYWMQYIGREKHRMYNPIQQNNGHARALKNVFYSFPSLPIIPIVVFLNGAELNVTATKNHVVYAHRLVDTIRSYHLGYIAQESVPKCVEVLQKAMSKVSEEQKTEHVSNIRQNVFSQQADLAFGFCPRCGHKLVLRHGTHGTFWGCSNYPYCHFTAQYDRNNPGVPKM